MDAKDLFLSIIFLKNKKSEKDEGSVISWEKGHFGSKRALVEFELSDLLIKH